MDLENLNGFFLRNLAGINVLLGKNGCGKSFALKQVEQRLQNREGIGLVRYISPERGGTLSYEPNIEQTMGNNPNWMLETRRKNQADNFRQQSATLFRRLEHDFLLKIEQDHGLEGYVRTNFSVIIDALNSLLDRVRLERDRQKGFKILDRENGNPAPPGEISSGEAELISLGIEFLAFTREIDQNKNNILLVDSPDVHLHPDLQDRLAKFIIEALQGKPITLVLATHSTSLLAGLSNNHDTNVAFMKRGVRDIVFKSVTDVDKSILPIFGAHPLSNVFNQAPVLLVEGEDDERIWQQAVRTSRGIIRCYPCDVGGKDRFDEYEQEVNNIIVAVYDNAKGFSLRDRDADPEQIDDLGTVIRMRLSCRTAENLMLSDDVLSSAGTNWQTFQEALRRWIESSVGHQYYAETKAFADGGFSRKDHDLKEIRNILVGLMTNKPWEVLVGQAIAVLSNGEGVNNPGSLRDFLGEKVCQTLLGLPAV